MCLIPLIIKIVLLGIFQSSFIIHLKVNENQYVYYLQFKMERRNFIVHIGLNVQQV